MTKLLKAISKFCLVYIFSVSCLFSQTNYFQIKDKLEPYIKSKFTSIPDSLVYIDIDLQKLFVISDTNVLKEYYISSSYSGSSFFAEFNSNKTPLGLHKIESKIGDNLPIGNIIKMKKILDSIGTIYREGELIPNNVEDVIMTRVLVLEGIEKGINKGKNAKGKIIDTFYRGIYIHGTNNEAELGKAVSHGCIRMKNEDIVELFNLVNYNTLILLL